MTTDQTGRCIACRSVIAVLVFACIHSALASRGAKQAVNRRLGARTGRGLYRIVYNVQGLVTATMLVLYVGKLPAQTLYRVRGRPAMLMRLVQIGGLVTLLTGLKTIGPRRFSGWNNLWAWMHGEAIPAGPVAQGPELKDERLTDGGPFRFSRHPLNFMPLLMIWSTPRLTTRRLGFNLASTLYLWLGSLHEEHRLKTAYGWHYEAYLGQGVPFFMPRFVPGRTRRPFRGEILPQITREQLSG